MQSQLDSFEFLFKQPEEEDEDEELNAIITINHRQTDKRIHIAKYIHLQLELIQMNRTKKKPYCHQIIINS